jgi:hypothetical protein
MSAPRCVISLNLLLVPRAEATILNMPSQAGKLTTFYMVFAMIGRFGGSVLLRYVKDYDLLALVAWAPSPLRGGDRHQGHDPDAARRHGEPAWPLCRAADQRL